MKEYFVEIDGVIVEVTKEVNDEVRSNTGESRHERYIICELAPMHELSLDGLHKSDYPVEMHMVNKQKTTEEQILNQIQLVALECALSHLYLDEQELIVAIFYEGLSERTVAQYLECSQSTVRHKKRKVLKKLKRLLTLYINCA